MWKVNHLPVEKGTLVTAHTGGGGGYGVPFQRDPEQVRQDLFDGYITPQSAEHDYGVCLDSTSLEVTKCIRITSEV